MWFKALLLSGGLLMGSAFAATEKPATDEHELIRAEGWELVKAHCGACHSTRLVTQNRMTRANWLYTIRWMQESQNLWDLGDMESTILDYLESQYGVPDLPLRRQPLKLD